MLSKQKKHKLETIGHYLTGIIVLVDGFERMEHFEERPGPVILLFILGIAIIIAVTFHRFFERYVREFKSLLHVFEFLVLLVIAYDYFMAGKKALPFAYLLAAAGNLVAAIIFHRKKTKMLKAGAHTADNQNHT